MADIDVMTILGPKCIPYVKLLRETGEVLKSHKHKIRWKAITTPYCRTVPSGFDNAHDLEPSRNETGIHHAEGHMAAIKAATSPYLVLTDIDVAFLKKDWDDDLVNNISKEVPIVGFERGYGYEKDNYQNFPCITFAAYDTEILKSLNVNLYQGTNRSRNLVTMTLPNQKLADAFGRSVGAEMLLETGWRLPFAFKNAGYKDKIMKKIMPFEAESRLPFDSGYSKRMVVREPGNKIMHEFYLDGELFGTHLRRSRKYPLIHPIAQVWVKKIKGYLKKEYNIVLHGFTDTNIRMTVSNDIISYLGKYIGEYGLVKSEMHAILTEVCRHYK